MPKELHSEVEAARNGMPIRSYAREVLGISSTLLKKMKREGGIFQNGRPVFVNETVQAGDHLCFVLPAEQPSREVLPQKKDLCILEEDEHLLVLNKPAGMAVHPDKRRAQGTVANYLLGHYEDQRENAACHLVNRLDAGTSGLMVVAKHAYAHERLVAQMKSGIFIRHYLALVHGAFSEPQGVVDAPLGHPPAATIKREVMADGKPAVTHYRVLCSRSSLSLLRLWLDTGRTHQIRAHMAHLGHPLYGDFLYGTEEAAMNRPALHSCYAAFQHPITGQKKAFCCAPPEDFRELALACFQADAQISIMEDRKGEKPQ